jgi:hypothetical protein
MALAVASASCGSDEDDIGRITCSVNDPLQLVLGDGEPGFEPLGPGAEPRLYHGEQGGHHLVLGVRVENPAVEQPGYRIDIRIFTRPGLCQGPSCTWALVGSRSRTVRDARSITPADDGAVVIDGLLVVVDSWKPTEERRATIAVTDGCGRAGLKELLWLLSAPGQATR